MAKKNIFLVHALLWLLVFVPVSFSSLLVFQYSPEVIKQIIPNVTESYLFKEGLINLSSLFITFYLFYFILFDWLFVRKFKVQSFLFAISLVLLIFWIEGLLVNWMEQDITSTYKASPAIIVSRILLLGFRIGFALGLRAVIRYILERTKRRFMESLHKKSQLELFKAKINPHFLFNTLNNIDALIHTNPDRASEVLIKLSEEMRYLVYESDVEKISLEKELNHIENYIHLEQLRVTDPDLVQYTVIGNPNAITIAPMIFIPFIENAFKHRSISIDNSPVDICVLIEDQQLRLEVKNHFEASNKRTLNEYSGKGLTIAKKRLEQLFSDKHTLDIKTQNGVFIVKLTIDLK